jgi:thioredoxin reductase (NADPH)
MDFTLELNPKVTGTDINHSGPQNYDVIIIGGGPAGASAAIYTSRAELKTLVIDRGLTVGALGMTSKIANYPGIPDEISGAELLERMRQQAQSFGAIFTQDKAVALDLNAEIKTVYTNGGTYTGRVIIIATGSMGRGQRVPGEDRLLGRGVSYCATCDAAFFRNQQVAVVGNSDEAIEEALYLTRFAGMVHLLFPTPELIAPTHLIEAINQNPKVTLYPGAVVREVIGETRVEAVRIRQRGQPERKLAVNGAFIYLQGGKPITDFLQGQIPTSDTGCLVVDHEFRTAIPEVYAVGDVLCNHVKQAVVAAAEGAVAAMAVEKVLRGRKQIAVDWAK